MQKTDAHSAYTVPESEELTIEVNQKDETGTNESGSTRI